MVEKNRGIGTAGRGHRHLALPQTRLAAALSVQDISLGQITLNVGTLMMSCMLAIVGFQLVAFAFFTKVFAIAEGLLPEDPKLTRVLRFFTLEKGILISVGVFLIGIAFLARAVWLWGKVHFGSADFLHALRNIAHRDKHT